MIKKRVLVTGASGFIGKNLVLRLKELDSFAIHEFMRADSAESLPRLVSESDFVIHLAGVNRPEDNQEFIHDNVDLTSLICEAIKTSGRKIPLIFTSSTQVSVDNPYGSSKLSAEEIITEFSELSNSPACIYRLPGIFGKFCKPNYNSVVATFCHNIARGLPVEIRDPNYDLSLVYVDDLIEELLLKLEDFPSGIHWGSIEKVYQITLAELAAQIKAFENCRTNLITEPVGVGLTRALYATYISYLPVDKFTYSIPQHSDERGTFVEMLKTPNFGQFSFFSVLPGVTRGSHYHHTKTEKFLVVKGTARIRFRHLITDEFYEIILTSDNPEVLDTIPGWVHDIKNIGDMDLIVMLWANELFDRDHPDTISAEV